MKLLFFVFAFAVSLSGLSLLPAAAETCSQAKGTCQNNCNRGWGGQSVNQKNACQSDCGARFNECLVSGSWRSNRPTIPQRDGLTKR